MSAHTVLRGVLWLSAILLIALGASVVIAPGLFAAYSGLGTVDPSGTITLQALVGGLEIGLGAGLIALLCLKTPIEHIAFAMLLVLASVVIARGIAILMVGAPDPSSLCELVLESLWLLILGMALAFSSRTDDPL